jgi:hypothetical protein
MAREYSWRDGGKPGERKEEALRSWQRDRDPTKERGGRLSRRAKLIIAITAILASMAGIVILIALLLWPTPSFVVLIGADYADNLAVPHNAYGLRGMKRIESWAKAGPVDLASDVQDRLNQSQVGKIEQSLKEQSESRLRGKWRKRETAVVYLALHGSVDAQGRPFFYLQDTSYGEYDPDKCLPLERLLSAVEGIDAEHKVLVLDATQVTDHWPSGMLYNTFAAELEKQVEKQAETRKDLVVISASGPEQRSWISRKHGCTIFSYFVAKGLSGGKGATNGAGRVTAQSLFDYVKAEVGKEVSGLYNAVQEPVLLGNKKDADKIVILRSEGKEATVDPEPAFFNRKKGDDPSVEELKIVADDLQKKWEKWEKFKNPPPTKALKPWVYYPHLWRLYQDWLLRYEDLLVAGQRKDSSTAAVETILTNLENRLTEEILRDPKSIANSLAMPTPLGISPGPDIDQAEFAKKWRARDKDEDSLKKYLLEKQRSEDRIQLVQFLLDEATAARGTESARAEIKAVARWLESIRLSSGTNPAEGHFLRMYEYLYDEVIAKSDKAKTGSPGPERVKEALAVRILAERSALGLAPDDAAGKHHPYSEQIQPWIKTEIEEGDVLRRMGEDLLFGKKDDWQKSDEHLKKAKRRYDDANRISADIRGAFESRDRAFAEMPYYVQYFGRKSARDDEGISRVRKLAEDARELSRLLDQRPTDSREKINKLRDSVDSKRKELEDNFLKYSGEVLKKGSTQEPLEDIEDLLSVPLIKWQTRHQLLEKRFTIVQDFAEHGTSAKPLKEHEENLWRLATRRGFAARTLFGDQRGEHQDELIRLLTDKNELFISRLEEEEKPEDWAKVLRDAGDEIGTVFQRLVKKVKDNTVEGVDGKDLAQCKTTLQTAEFRARLLDGAGAHVFAQPEQRNPALENCKLRLHDLLVWQAHRAYKDHWFDQKVNGTDQPYYPKLVETFLADAKDLVERKDLAKTDERNHARLASVTTADEQFKKRDNLATGGLSEWTLTSEVSLPLDYEISAPKDAFPGFPVFWTLPTDLAIKDDGNGERLALDKAKFDKGQHVFSMRLQTAPLRRSTPTNKNTAHVGDVGVQGIFRGQVSDKTIPINFDPMPDIVAVERYSDEKSGVAVRSDQDTRKQLGLSDGALVIILDCSNSMTTDVGGGKTRFDLVREALGDMLENVPNGAQVSIWVYGEEIKGKYDGGFTDAELSVQPLLGNDAKPVKWDRSKTAMRQRINESLKLLNAVGFTPIVHTMCRARDDLRGVEGRKVMVVLTDGDDNRFEPGSVGVDVEVNGKRTREQRPCPGDKDFNPEGRKISEFLKDPATFKDRKIEIHMVGFQIVKKEEERTREQFEKVLNNGKDLPRSSFSLIQQKADLVEKLRQILEPRIQYIVRDGQQIVGDPDGIDVANADLEKYPWYQRLLPGEHDLRLRQNPTTAARVNVNQGDYLLLKLKPQQFVRDIWGDQMAVHAGNIRSRYRQQKKEEGWLAAITENYFRPAETPCDLRMMLTIEDTNRVATGSDNFIRQVRPSFTWIEIKPPEDSKRMTVRVNNLEHYPAPAWEVNVPYWPTAANNKKYAPELDVWWTETPPSAKGSFKKSRMQDRSELLDVQMDGERKVQIESVLPETHKFADKEEACLAVRLRYPNDQPVLVRPRGGSRAGSEHQIFRKENKYTGFFVLPGDPGDVELELISLQDVKDEIEKNGLHLVFGGLDPPSGSPHRPQPVKFRSTP